MDKHLGPEWKPSRSKFVLAAEGNGNRITAYMHPSHEAAWKKEPFFSQLKQWALDAAPHNGQVLVCNGKRVTVVLPDREVDLGVVEEDELIVTFEKDTPHGIVLVPQKIRRDDPRVSGMEPGKAYFTSKKSSAL